MNDWDIDLVEYISNLKKLHFAKAPEAFSSISSLYACLSKCYL